ncbi:hypothetical protein [Rhodococcus sp. X156]|uniref:hypothetical protein n=1 Tax=Rhodococcus sp. X156 TaxID=2499145 RepID=UPI0013E28C49|nr:hypothetical protein [Rhodococcus sp. X156]
MFESATLSEHPRPGACTTEELVALMAAHARAEAAHAAGKLAAVAELYRRRCEDDLRAQVCAAQVGEFVAAEVGVALTVSRAMAGVFVHVGRRWRSGCR